MKRLTFKLLVLCAALAGQASFPLAWAAVDHPIITVIRMEGTMVLVTAEVPAGIQRVVLEGRSRLGAGAWEPRAVARLENGQTSVAFRLSQAASLDFLRVRADATDPLPASFYRGTNSFAGPVYSYDASLGPVVYFGDFTRSTEVTGNPPADAPREVVESDIWKLRGDTLYFFNQFRGLQVIDLSNPDAPALSGTLNMPAAGEQMYLLDDNHVLLLARNGCYWREASSDSQVILVRVDSGVPRLLASLAVPGQIQESRLVGTALYVASQTYRPVDPTERSVWQWGTVVSSFDFSNPSAPIERSNYWFEGYGNVITATDRFLFVATRDSRNWSQSAIQCLDISGADGTVNALSSIRTAGWIKDKFKMNLSGDIFTAISETSAQGRIVTKLETFSMADPSQPARLGQIELGHGEQLFATRFDGNRVYVVTFLRIDPLWVVDLSDPARPQIKGELEIPGWSTFIYPMGDRLVTMGIDNTGGWRVAVSLFDVKDPARPALLSKVPLGINQSWSEANSDEKAFGVLPDAGLILVPFSSFSTNQQQGVQLIDLNRDSLTKRGVVAHRVQPRRATLHRDRVLSISGRELLSVDATDRDRPLIRAEMELSWNVDRLFVEGDYLVALSGARSQGQYLLELTPAADSSGAQSERQNLLRVTPVADSSRVLGQILLGSAPFLGATVKDQKLFVLEGNAAQIIWPVTKPDENIQPPPTTNSGTLTLTIFDLSGLPEVKRLGQTSSQHSDYWLGLVEPLWPKPGLLVWSGQQSFYFLRGGPIGIVEDRAGLFSLAPYPYWGGAAPNFLAYDVSVSSDPELVSSLDLRRTNNWWGFSKSSVGGGLIYLSHQTVEVFQTTNHITVTNITITTVTNYATVTNLTKVPYSIVTTNSSIVTNQTAIALKNRLVNLSLPNQKFVPLKVSAGQMHSLALADNGTVWSWGGNYAGQLGDGSIDDRREPLPVPGLDVMLAIAAGGLHSLAVGSDGSVWAWGADDFGQLGNGLSAIDPNLPPFPEFGSPKPVKIPELNGIIAAAAGQFHSLALQAEGLVWAWGRNESGQIGDGTRADQVSPVRLDALNEIIALAGGYWHSLALQKNGTVWAWGNNRLGQLGDGTTQDRARPAAILGLDRVTAIAAGTWHNLALTADGAVWAWGQNEQGQLGDGTLISSMVPKRVPSLTGIISLAAGTRNSLALKDDGTLWLWGEDSLSREIQAEPIDPTIPRPWSAGQGTIALASGREHNLVSQSDGLVLAWGGNRYQQLGNGEPLLALTYQQVNTYTTNTAYAMVTNYVQAPIYTYVTNYNLVTKEQIIGYSMQRHFLDVIDYSDPANPTLRQPVNIPGNLAGLAQDGALVYTVGQHSSDPAKPDWTEWLDASAYDGVAAYLVDSLALPQDWPRPLLAQGPTIYLGRANSSKNQPQIEAWALSGAGKFIQLLASPLRSAAQQFAAPDGLLAVQTQTSLQLFDASDPGNLKVVGEGKQPGCIGYNLDLADGDLNRGLWIPLGDYGVLKVDRAPAADPGQ